MLPGQRSSIQQMRDEKTTQQRRTWPIVPTMVPAKERLVRYCLISETQNVTKDFFAARTGCFCLGINTKCWPPTITTSQRQCSEDLMQGSLERSTLYLCLQLISFRQFHSETHRVLSPWAFHNTSLTAKKLLLAVKAALKNSTKLKILRCS